jgi:hypothetical protein
MTWKIIAHSHQESSRYHCFVFLILHCHLNDNQQPYYTTSPLQCLELVRFCIICVSFLHLAIIFNLTMSLCFFCVTRHRIVICFSSLLSTNDRFLHFLPNYLKVTSTPLKIPQHGKKESNIHEELIWKNLKTFSQNLPRN